MAPEDTAAATGAAPQKSKKMLFIGVAVGFLVLACINGLLVWKVLSHDSADAKVMEPESPAVKGKEGFMFSLEPFIVNLFDEKGVRYLKVRLDVEVYDSTKEEMEKKNAKIRDSLIVLLSSKKYEEIGSLEGKARLREEILFRLNRILGEGKAREVYFTDFVVQ